MNATNRALNRIVIGVVGLAALAAATGAVLLLVDPAFGRGWSDAGRRALAIADRLFAAPLWAGTTVSGAALLGLLAAAVFVLLLAAFVLRQGRGATSTVVTALTDDGAVEIDTAVTAALLAHRLDSVPGVAGTAVSAYRVRRSPALKVTVRCRRGASPRTIVDALDAATAELHTALGTPLPVFAQLVGGVRARTGRAVRVDTTPSTSAARPS